VGGASFLLGSRPDAHLHAVLSVHCPGALSTLPTLEKCESRQATEPSISARLLDHDADPGPLIRKAHSILSIRKPTQAAEAEQEALATLAASLDGVVRPDPRDGPHISPQLPTSPHISPHLPTAPHMSPHISTAPCAEKRGRDCALDIACTEPPRAALDDTRSAELG